MPSPTTPGQQLNNLAQLFINVVNSDLVDALARLWQLSRRVLAAKTHEGMYEVLDFDVCLELKNAKGSQAVLHKRQLVRFRQNNIIAYQDKAWGDGDIFADYQCAPGVAVDRYREGHRWRILISLRETKNAGDVEDFQIDRVIKNGFTRKTEELQIEIDHATRQFTMSVVFPASRIPRKVLLIQQNAGRTIPLGPQQNQTLPDGRHKVAWGAAKPALFEAYILHWEW